MDTFLGLVSRRDTTTNTVNILTSREESRSWKITRRTEILLECANYQLHYYHITINPKHQSQLSSSMLMKSSLLWFSSRHCMHNLLYKSCSIDPNLYSQIPTYIYQHLLHYLLTYYSIYSSIHITCFIYWSYLATYK